MNNAENEATFERTLLVDGPLSLDVGTHSGTVRIARGDDGRVQIRGIFRARRSLFGFGDTPARVQDLAARPPIEQRGNCVRLGDLGDRWLMRGITMLLDVTVPHDTRVRGLVDAGDIRIEGIAGPVDCEADAGRIEIYGVDSGVRASADSGSVHIRAVKGAVQARTDSGSIDALEIAASIDVAADSGAIRLSQTVAAPVRAEADSGSITVRLVPDAGYNLRVHTDSGHLNLPEMQVRGGHGTRNLEGQVRGGGPMVWLETDSGSIDVT